MSWSRNTILMKKILIDTDFEDALQNFSATNSGKIKIVITRNTKDFRHSRLKVMTPKEFSTMEA